MEGSGEEEGERDVVGSKWSGFKGVTRYYDNIEDVVMLHY